MEYKQRVRGGRYWSEDNYSGTKEEWLDKGVKPEDLIDFSDRVNTSGCIPTNRYTPLEKEKSPDRHDLSTTCLRPVYEYGDIATPFKEYMQSNPEPHGKAEVARIIGTIYYDRAYVQLLYRHIHVAKDVKLVGDKIQWVNKDWQKFLVDPNVLKRPFLNLLLPFGAEKLIATPERTTITVAGEIGSGKTHWGMLTADLNLGKLPIRHFILQDGGQSSAYLLDDFPQLKEAYLAKDGRYYLINPRQWDGLDVAENLDPDGLNIFDWLRLQNSKNWFIALQQELARLGDNLGKGAVMVMLQKPTGAKLAYGKDFTKADSGVYFSLTVDKNILGDENAHGSKECHVTIEKCRSYASKRNPEALGCAYRTAPLHGKLIPDGKGWMDKRNWDK